jgi:GT2 family glycosyltransferase
MSVTTSILVATRNRPELLRECLESLVRCGLEDAEVLVLDQSGDGQSEALVRELGVDRLRYTRLPLPGKSRALNAGIAMARGARIALTDDDCEVAEDWLKAMDRAFKEAGEDRRVVICGRVLPGRHAPDGQPPPSCVTDPEPRRYSGRVGRDVVYQNWAVRRAVFDEVGGFDERLGPGGVLRNAEDNDMAYRWLRAGYEVLYRPEIVVRHNGWRRREEL